MTTEYLTVEEAAKLLRQSPATVRRKVAHGEIAAVRLGDFGPLRVPAGALEQHLRPALKSRRTSVAAAANDAAQPARPARASGDGMTSRSRFPGCRMPARR